MDMPVALAIAGLVFVAGVLGLFLLFGLRSGRGDLVAPPKEFGKREYGQRPVIRPAPAGSAPRAPQLAAKPPGLEPQQGRTVPPAAPSPEGPAERAPVWRRDRPAGHARLSEASYTAEQYAEREVKALLLQNRTDRAIRHVRSALKLPAAEAEAYVERLARGF